MPDPLIITREGDPEPFNGIPRLNGYAIIPKALWDDLDQGMLKVTREVVAAMVGRALPPGAADNKDGYIVNSYFNGFEPKFKLGQEVDWLEVLKGYVVVPLEYLAP